MSTTVSIGVESVTVIGAMSKIFFSFNGAGPRFWTGELLVKITSDCPVMPSNDLFSFAVEEILSSGRNRMEIVKLTDR